MSKDNTTKKESLRKRYEATPELYTNRELSWLDFNDRVLEEARDAENPLLERCSFLGITQSNVDEFFMVRVASLNKLAAAGISTTDPSGLTPQEQVDAVNAKEHDAVERRYSTYNRSLLPLLEKHDIRILKPEDLNEKQLQTIQRYFNDELYPVLTPMAEDSSRPFPFLQNNSLNLAIILTDEENPEKKCFATLRVPDLFPRLFRLSGAENHFVLLEDIIRQFLGTLFHGYHVIAASAYRLIRDMDLDVAEHDSSDLLRAVKNQLREREHGNVMRLEIENNMSTELANHLVNMLHVQENTVYRINGPIDLTFLKKLGGAVKGHDELRYAPMQSYHVPALDGENNIFDAIRERDYFVQHPYDSFDAVVNFIRQAASDPDVLAIKMTLYRVSGNSPIIKYLGKAAQHGKQVTVLVEVKARFDEENNVRWSMTLEKMGCHVIYGLVGLKTHSKIALVIRRDNDGIRRYLHLGTGNYNDVTAHFYTDMGLFTCNRDMGVDATNLFNMLSGFSRPPYFRELRISPHNIREFIYEKIDAEIHAAQEGRPAHIRMKMNSLSDSAVIAKLYEASHAGVRVDLIVRGICCLRTNIPEVSENIEVHSIVGRFLEHSRIYWFYADGNEDTYLASADMMTRNLNRRVEILFPILQEDLKERTHHIFKTMWQDNVKTRVMRGTVFERLSRRGLNALDSQQAFIDEAERMNKKLRQAEQKKKKNPDTFQPMMKHDDELADDNVE